MRGMDGFGGMPFAVIAVALLLASTALAAAAYQYGNADDGAGGVVDDIDAVDEAVADIQVHVNRGLGELVRGLSTASDGSTDAGDTVAERSERFTEVAAWWLENQFPVRSGGAMAHLKGYDLALTAQALELASDAGDGGYTPAYLKGSGTVTVEVVSESGKGTVDLEVSTDGSYALPLAAERLSLFESMAGSGGISVSEMMSYQLTSLAQYRVLNGYGGRSEYGDRGTGSILTEEDVRQAYRNAMDAVSMICFRDAEGNLAGHTSADLADLLAAEDGMIELDLAALYAQALMSAVDDMALRWFDYFCGFEILDMLEDLMTPYKRAISALCKFLEGERGYSAVPYIVEVMELADVDETVYGHPGHGTTTVSAAGITVTVSNPTYDVLSAGWLRDFRERYEEDTNFVMDFILDVLRLASVRVAESRDLGVIRCSADPYDGIPFIESLTGLFESAVADGIEVVDAAVSSSLASSTVYDPFYGAIADEVMSHSGEMVLSGALSSRISGAFAAAIPEGSEVTVEDLHASGEIERAVADYERSVYRDLKVYDRMRQVADGDGFVKTVLSRMCAFGLDEMGITDLVPEKAEVMGREILGMMAMNPHGGVTELPGDTGFRLDDTGCVTVETLDIALGSDPVVREVSIDRDRCVHNVGFRDDSSAAYTTVFTIEVADLADVRVTGSGALAGAMGTESSVIEQSIGVEASIEVTVSSGWALAGIEYRQSSTFYNDLWMAVLEILEPLIEPLRMVMEAARGMVSAMAEALMEALSFVTERLMVVYEMLMGPLAQLRDWIESEIEEVFADAAMDVLFSIALDEQRLTFVYGGCTLEISTDAVTWFNNTKELISVTMTMPVSDLTVTAGIHVKVRGDLEPDNLIITGEGGVAGDDWSVEMTLDPLMKGSKYLVTADCEIGDTDISIAAPKLDSYHEMGIALSDVPGLGEVISSIPVGGVTVGLDAGFSLKYTDPADTGLIVNEFETNPAGEDRGREWVELLNNSTASIDLDGYTLTAASDRRQKVMELSGTIAPGEFLVIEPDFVLVNTSGKYTKNGEAIVIKDPDGNEVDRTPTKQDTANDGMTWQRSYDGSTEWVFAEGTMGRTNNAYPGSSIVSAAQMKEVVWSAVEKSFDRVPAITDLETMQEFMEYLVRYTLEGLIKVVTGRIIEASMYVSVDVGDLASVSEAGVRVALRTDGDLAEDVLKYLAGKVMELAMGARNPYSIDPLGMFTENIDLEVTVHAGIGFPELLSDGRDMPGLDVGVTFRTNIAGITRLAGMDTGRPEVVMGVRVIGIPEEALPSRLSAREGMDQDLWLMLVTVRFA